jgi:hypothetical protein
MVSFLGTFADRRITAGRRRYLLPGAPLLTAASYDDHLAADRVIITTLNSRT